MALVKIEMVLYTMWEKAHESPAEFMWLFKSQLDTINLHGGREGYHPKPYKDNLTLNRKAENTAYKESTKEMQETTLDESWRNIRRVYLSRTPKMGGIGVCRPPYTTSI